MKAWHFIQEDRRMRFNKKELIEAGKTYRVEGKPVLCEHGLHASVKAIDALLYAPGPIICRVRLGGRIVKDINKAVATKRTVIWMADATKILRDYARWCALSVAHLCDMPDVVRQYLESGNEDLRDAARAAAWDAARAADRAAAKAAAWAAAWAADRAADRAAAWASQNNELEKRLRLLK